MANKKKNEISISSSAAEYLTFIASYGESDESVEMRYEDENIWLTQKMMATLYDVDVRTIKPKNEKTSDIRSAILETAKYPVKPMELNSDSAKVVDDLQKGLYRKRQIAFGGPFKQIKKELELDDIENGDLIRVF